MEITRNANDIDIIWNYECIRDFCGGFYHKLNVEDKLQKRNHKLIYNLPMAISKYAKMNNISTKEIFDYIFADAESLVDYRTGIDCKKVIIDNLIGNHEVITETELAAILNVIYIDNFSAELERIAYEL